MEDAARQLFPFLLIIGLWIAWSDLWSMTIPNRAILALLAVWALYAPALLPFGLWSWASLYGVMVLVVGFGLFSIGLIGGGDAKAAAVMTPFLTLAPSGTLLPTLGLTMIACYFGHRFCGLLFSGLSLQRQAPSLPLELEWNASAQEVALPPAPVLPPALSLPAQPTRWRSFAPEHRHDFPLGLPLALGLNLVLLQAFI